jgi:hypothetical protein
LLSIVNSKVLIFVFLNSNNENKPVTNSRDTQEVPLGPGKEMLKIFNNFQHTTCLLDDFEYYNRKQELRNAGIDPDSVEYSTSSTLEPTNSSHFHVTNMLTNTKTKSVPYFKKPPSTKPKDATNRKVNFNKKNNSNANTTTTTTTITTTTTNNNNNNNSRRLLRRN